MTVATSSTAVVDYSTFVAVFPEFGNATTYPQAQVDFWIAQAALQLNAGRLGRSLDLATMLFVAHNLTLSNRAANGRGSGGSTGLVSSKSVGGVSVSYDTSSSAYKNAGIWNATAYGQRLYQMFRSFSAGPIYVTPDMGEAASPTSPYLPI